MCYVIKAVAFVRYKLLRRQCDFEKARSNHEGIYGLTEKYQNICSQQNNSRNIPPLK